MKKALLALLLSAGCTFSWAQDKVVYHFSDAAGQALSGLRNIKNHLDIDSSAQITAVALGNGVDFLMQDAKDRNGNPYDITIEELARRGVKFEVCEVTLKNRDLKKEQFIPEASFTPSGVVRVTKLQIQGYAYIRP